MASVALTIAALGVLVTVTWGASTVMVALALRVVGLLLVEVTLAVLTNVPTKPTTVVPLTTKVTVAPAARVPRLSETVLVPESKAAGGAPLGLVMTPVQVTPVGVGSTSLTL